MSNTTLDPEEWLWLTRAQADDLVKTQSWPFTNATTDHVYSLVDILSVNKNLHSIIKIVGSVIPGFGIFGSIFLIGTFWHKAFVDKNSFFAVMMLIAVLDLIFNILDTAFNLCYRTWKITGHTDPVSMWIVASFRGTAYAASLASDICALFITLERYVAVSYPQFYRNLSGRRKKIMWTIAMVITFLLSITRLHYTLAMQVQHVDGSKYIYMQSKLGCTQFVVGMATFADTILPIILILITVGLSTKFRIAVIKRQKQKTKVVVIASTNQTTGTTVVNGGTTKTTTVAGQGDAAKTQGQNSASNKLAVTLTYILDAFLIIDNLGYCLYFAAELMLAQNSISYDSSFEELWSFCNVHRIEAYASLTAVTVECLTRALNFPVYMALSASVRKEFREFLGKLKMRAGL